MVRSRRAPVEHGNVDDGEPLVAPLLRIDGYKLSIQPERNVLHAEFRQRLEYPLEHRRYHRFRNNPSHQLHPLGTGDDVQKSQMLVQIAQAQAVVAQSPYAERLLNPKKIYNVQARLAETAGFKNPGEFWVDPDSLPPAQPKQAPPDPKILLEQAKLQNDVHKTQAEMQIEQQQGAMELEFKRKEAELDRQNEMAMMQLKIESEERIRAAELLMEQTRGMNPASSSSEPDNDDSNEQSSNVKIMLEQMQNTMTTLAESISAPKIVVRDEDGTVVGIQTLGEDVSVQKSVIRDNQGNIVGLH